MADRTIILSDEQIDAVIPQIVGRLDALQKLAEESKDFGRIMELVPTIGNIREVYNILSNARCSNG